MKELTTGGCIGKIEGDPHPSFGEPVVLAGVKANNDGDVGDPKALAVVLAFGVKARKFPVLVGVELTSVGDSGGLDGVEERFGFDRGGRDGVEGRNEFDGGGRGAPNSGDRESRLPGNSGTV